MREIYDISIPLVREVEVYPGDTPLTYEKQDEGPHIKNSALTTTLHVGTHVDAPVHVEEGGQAVGEMDLDYFLGPCQVMEVLAPGGTLIGPSQIKEIRAPRLLFRTGSFPDYQHWQEYAGLSEELINYLHQRGVILIGIDTPSIDLLHQFQSHREAISCKMAILEGLDLSQVPEGCYELIALPLPLMEADGSPVRAVLTSKKEEGW